RSRARKPASKSAGPLIRLSLSVSTCCRLPRAGLRLREASCCASLVLSSVPPQGGEARMRCGILPYAAAAPATVSGHPRSTAPDPPECLRPPSESKLLVIAQLATGFAVQVREGGSGSRPRARRPAGDAFRRVR